MGITKALYLETLLVFFSKQEFISPGNTLFIRLSDHLQECPKNSRKMPLNARKNLKNRAIKYPNFGVFLLFQNHQTLINSHFMFLKERYFGQKRVIFEG